MVCADTLSHKRSVGFRSGEREGQSVASKPVSGSIIQYMPTCPGTMRPGIALHHSVWSDEYFTSVPHSRRETVAHSMEVCADVPH